MSAVRNLRVPWNAGNFLTSCKPVRFSRRTLYHEVSKHSYILTLSSVHKCLALEIFVFLIAMSVSRPKQTFLKS